MSVPNLNAFLPLFQKISSLKVAMFCLITPWTDCGPYPPGKAPPRIVKSPVGCPLTSEGEVSVDSEELTKPVRLYEARNVLITDVEKMWFSDRVMYCERLVSVS